MSSVPPTHAPSAAQRLAERHARDMACAFDAHRRALGALGASRGGACLADGREVLTWPLDADFDVDSALLRALLAGPAGPSMRAMPPAGAAQGPSALEQYLFPADPTAPEGSLARLRQETPGAVAGPGNVLGNMAGAAGGVLQGLGERTGRAALERGVAAILSGQATRVVLAPGVELYNPAQGRQAPRVRLRVRGLPVTEIRAMVPASGGPVTQWRINAAGNTASLGARSMTAQQLRQTSILIGQERLPRTLRWATGGAGAGIVTFAPTAALDLAKSIESDGAGGRRINWRTFAVEEARNQSGNAAGFATGLMFTWAAGALGGAALAASAPVLILALAAGVAVQVAWNAYGGSRVAGEWAQSALR